MSLPTLHALNKDSSLTALNNPDRHVPVAPSGDDTRAPCPVCAIDSRVPGNTRRARYNHHALLLHVRQYHPAWNGARIATTWPTWWLEMRARCAACATMARARALRHEKRTPPGALATSAPGDVFEEPPRPSRRPRGPSRPTRAPSMLRRFRDLRAGALAEVEEAATP